MAAGGDGFNHDFWIGMITAGPVLLVAYGTIILRAVDAMVGSAMRGRGRTRRVLGVLGAFAGTVVLALGLLAALSLTIEAALTLQYRDRRTSETVAFFLLTFGSAVFILLILLIGVLTSVTRDESPTCPHLPSTTSGDKAPIQPTPAAELAQPAHRSAALLLAAAFLYRAIFRHPDRFHADDSAS